MESGRKGLHLWYYTDTNTYTYITSDDMYRCLYVTVHAGTKDKIRYLKIYVKKKKNPATSHRTYAHSYVLFVQNGNQNKWAR